MKEYLSLIQKSELFRHMSERETESILSCLSAAKKRYKKGEFVYCVGDKITEVALLLEGSVHIQKEDFWGNQSIMTEISEGQLFGETYACMDRFPIAVNAVAVKDSTVLLLQINRILTTCYSTCTFHTRLIQNLIAVIALKNKLLTGKLEHMSQRTTRNKLLSYLSEQSIKTGSSVFEVSFNRQQLADYLAVDRSAMSNELSKLKEEGCLDFAKNHFELL